MEIHFIYQFLDDTIHNSRLIAEMNHFVPEVLNPSTRADMEALILRSYVTAYLLSDPHVFRI